VSRHPLFLAVLVVLLIVGACSSGDSAGAPAAATVNGVDISEEALLDQLAAASAIEAYGPQLLGLTQPVAGEGENTYSTAASAEVLTTLVAFELIDQEVDDRDIELTQQDLDTAEQTALQILGTAPETGQPDPEAGQAAFDQLSEEAQTTLIEGLAGAAVLGEEFAAEVEVGEVTDEAVREAFDASPDQFAQEESCVRHVLIIAGDPESGVEPTAEESDAARAEAEAVASDLQGGADFATVASEQSDDTTSAVEGGDLGCNAREVFIPEFDEAVWSMEPGTISAVVQSPAGFHVLEVTERRTPTFEDVAEEIRGQLQAQTEEEAQTATQEIFAQIILDADVSIDPRYGTWEYFIVSPAGGEEMVDGRDDAQLARVVPPGGPVTTTTLGLDSLLGDQPLAPAGE
jgi:parvulin-like peptidyl-prolyl isomerase